MASPRMREVLEALEWVRGEMWRFSSPDFIRQRELERRVGDLCARLVQGSPPAAGDITPSLRKRQPRKHY